jgi:hypothetical protein
MCSNEELSAHILGKEVAVRTTASVLIMKSAFTRGRRTNRRLRAVIESLRAEIRDVRHLVDVNTIRLGQVQAEVDRLQTSKS